MAVPWLRILDAVIGVTDLARSRKIRALSDQSAQQDQQIEATGRGLGGLETRLAGVVVAALKEAFDRDTRRLELERQQLEAERQRAERALRLELMRQAGDREIGRLRLLAGIGVASWIGTLFFSARLIGAGAAPRVMLGAGWLFLLAAIALAFSAQSQVARDLQRAADDDGIALKRDVSSGAGAVSPWLIVVGLALVGIAVLVA